MGHTIVSIVVETCRNAEEAVGDEDRLHRAHGPDTGKMRIRPQGQQSPRSAVRVRPYVLSEMGACADHKQSLGSVHGARGVGALKPSVGPCRTAFAGRRREGSQHRLNVDGHLPNAARAAGGVLTGHSETSAGSPFNRTSAHVALGVRIFRERTSIEAYLWFRCGKSEPPRSPA